jgi:hypothetical protein
MRKIEEKRKGADRQLRLSTIYAQGRRQPARAPTRRIFVLRTNPKVSVWGYRAP